MISFILPNHSEPYIHNTISDIESLFPGCQIVIYHDRYSKGKGWAIREAVKEATGDIIIFLDGDGDIHPREAKKLLRYLENYDIVVGTKEIKGLFTRKLITILSRLYIRLLFNIHIDTQTGIKVFRDYALPTWETNGFAFDIEILCKAKEEGYSMAEIPIVATIWQRMPIKAILRTLWDSLKLYASRTNCN